MSNPRHTSGRIVVNTYASWWRRRWRGELPTAELPESGSCAGDLEQRDVVWTALGRLPRRMRAVVVLRYYEDLSEAEIARILRHHSTGTVKSQCSKAPTSPRRPDAHPPTPPWRPHDAHRGRPAASCSRATCSGSPRTAGRLPEVHRRIAVARRRRRATASGALALAVAGIALAVALPGTSHHAGIAPAAPATPYPTYTNGGRAIGGEQTVSGQNRTFSYSFTPTSYDLFLTATCGRLTSVTVTVNGHHLLDGTCDAAVTGSGNPADDRSSRTEWSAVGVVLKRPNVVTVTVGSIPGPPTAGIAVTSAIYQAVPAEDYPLPPRPAVLQTPMPDGGGRPTYLYLGESTGTAIVDSRRVGPTGTFTASATVGSSHEIDLSAVGPGQIELRVNGIHLQTSAFWTWTGTTATIGLTPSTLHDAGIDATDGQVVTLTVIASRFTGPYWTVYAH